MIVVGLMSGTSADGVDAAVVKLEGSPPALAWEVLGHTHRSFPRELRAEIFACFQPESGSVDRLCRLNFLLGREFGTAVLNVVEEAGLSMDRIDLIGSHGQTVWHEPPIHRAGSTLQIGEPALIAEMTGVPVVSSFRTRDMAVGGQGAPLVPLADWLLLSHPSRTRVAQNIGGIANVTFLPPTGGDLEPQGVIAFDTGPGNMLIDEAARLATRSAWEFDHDGGLALQGNVDESLLASWLAEPYFQKKPPRTTGRELFGIQRATDYWNQAIELGLSPSDVVATLTALTARSIEHAYRTFLPAFPEEVIVSGGGVRNHTLMAMLKERLAPAKVSATEKYGLASEAKEAVAFAVLAYQTWHRRPGNIPSATGAARAVVLGSITY
jgi:anhydro-N-acetylmuramic acid kinase